MENNCLICNSEIKELLSINFLFNFKPYQNKYMCELCEEQFIKITGDKCISCCKKGDFQSKICLECDRWSNLYKF